MSDEQTTTTGDHVALCPGCATETGHDDDAHSHEPELTASIACEHCGATLGGFYYVVPRDVYTGMVPGPG